MVDLRIRFYLYLMRTMALIKDQFKSKHWCLILSLLCVCTLTLLFNTGLRSPFDFKTAA